LHSRNPLTSGGTFVAIDSGWQTPFSHGVSPAPEIKGASFSNQATDMGRQGGVIDVPEHPGSRGVVLSQQGRFVLPIPRVS